MATLLKLPNESRVFLFDYSNFPELQATPPDTIASGTVTPTPAGLTVSGGTPNSAQTGLQVTISGGTAGTAYALECEAVTAGGSTLGQTHYLNVVFPLPN